MEQEERHRSNVRRAGKKVMGGCCILSFGIVLVLLIWFQIGSRVPRINIPTPTMPSPNAFDFFNSASAQLQDGSKIDDAISLRPRATYTLADKEGFLSDNAAALQTLRQGFAYDYMNPPARSYTTLFPYYAKFRSIARLLKLEGQVKAEKGDWSGAVNSDLDAVKL
ncbi:MAG TPA: hypothetical protein VKU00_18335, partial [Chthonomonadaceae bacterium]|nr:hypothetical protein [Chthonomonadaceae bacterium]